MLWEGHAALGNRFVEISATYFGGTRSENHIKNRWYSASFKKFVAKEFGSNAYHARNDQTLVSSRNAASASASLAPVASVDVSSETRCNLLGM